MCVIYGLIDPRDGRLRYVGMTKQAPRQRLAAHIHAANKPADQTRRAHWIRALLAHGLRPVAVVLEETTESAMAEREVAWIARLQKRGLDLTNLAPGGEGRRGPMSDIAKQRMSAAGLGRKKSEAHRRAISAALKGRPAPPRTDEWRAAHAAKLRGRTYTEEHRRHMAEAARRRRELVGAADTCRQPDCDRPVHCRGACHMHYQRARAGHVLELPLMEDIRELAKKACAGALVP